MRSIYLIVVFVLIGCGHTQPAEVEVTPKQEKQYEVPKGEKVLGVLRCIGECKSPLDTVLKSTGGFQSKAAPAEKSQVLEKKSEVPKRKRKIAQEAGIFAALKGNRSKKNRNALKDGKKKVPKKEYKVLAVLGSKKSASQSKKGILATRDEAERKAIREAGHARPFGKDFPVATTDGCDNLANQDQRGILSKRIVDSMHAMLKDKNTDCAWSKRYLQCGGALVVIGAYNNAVELKIAQVKNIYQFCQE